jgi:TonB family protein
MKTLIRLSFIFLLIFCAACGSVDTLKNTEANYTPPALAYQPRFYYPETAQENAFSGNTKLYLFIEKTGDVGKVMIIKSSRYDILDNAAIEYCKTLKFKPAKLNDEAIESRLVWEMKYNLSDKNWSVENYINDIDRIYSNVKDAVSPGRKEMQDEILKLHTEFIVKMNDRLNYNRTISRVILPSITENWRRIWDSWPLSFLLYHDFIQRFPDYDSLAYVKILLKNALKQDVQIINSTFVNNSEAQAEKDNVLMRIKKCVSVEYPDIQLNDLGFEIGKEVKPISSTTDR